MNVAMPWRSLQGNRYLLLKGSPQMKNQPAGQRQVILAAFVAGLLTFLFGKTYYALAAQVSGPVDKTPIDPAALEQLPRQIGDWTGQDIPVDEAIRDRTGADAIINRRYVRPYSPESVGLYVASGVSARALVGHRPEVCFIASGWTLMDRHRMELPLADGTELPCSVFQFSRGMLDTERTTVLHYYIVDGEYCGDVSLLRKKVWRGSRMVDYATQVQIVVSTEILTTELTMKLVSGFAVDSASSILRLFEDRQDRPQSGRVATDDFRSAIRGE